MNNETVSTLEIFMNLYRKEYHKYLDKVDNYEYNCELRKFETTIKANFLCENVRFFVRAIKKLLNSSVIFLLEVRNSREW